ncbi:MAG: CotH kinase family protein [Crocinitomicaceae bacterium]|nr:CotH kinase family protein [Crocinitomicaceae bacterium]
MKVLLSISFMLMICSSAISQNLYDIDHITEIRLTFDEANWDDTLDQYYANGLDQLLNATCEINNQSTFYNVGVAYKGNSTYNSTNNKNPLKIKLAANYYQAYQECRTLKLSNGKNDPSFVREVLSYEIGRKYMDMPFSNYAKVYINDNYYGLFSSSESINGDFMEKRFYCDDDNVNFKCNPSSVMGGNGSSLMYLGSDSSLYYDFYELQSDYGWAQLVNLCNQLQINLAGIEQYLDVDRTLWMLAFNNVLANMDSYSGPFRQNFYMIQDDNGRFMPIIWDLNECIGGFEMVNNSGGGPPSPPALTDLTEMDPYLRESDNTYPLIYYLFSNSRYRKMYMAHCRTMLEENITNGWYYTRAQELQTIIDAEVQADPNAFYTHSQFTTNLDNSTGMGPESAYGVKQVLDARNTYLTAHAAYNLTQPTISNIVAPSSPNPNTTITFTADIQTANYAYIGWRDYQGNAFTKVEMFDDGAHGDGAAADGIWGTSISIGAADIEYYIYAENASAGKFSPVRAEHEFYYLNIIGDVVINEMMPSNNSTAADQDGEYDDWIEFYNNSSSSVDLSGYYLTDDSAIPLKWQFPSGAVIPANDYLIVWADNDVTQTGLHANFKISNGESITFSDASGNAINTVMLPPVPDNRTYGRYPNGTGNFIPMMPTYNAENSYTALSVKEEELTEIVMFPNPTADFVQINLGDYESVSIMIFDLQGRVLFNDVYTTGDQIDVSEFTKGTYLVHIADKNWTKKLIVY